MPTNWKALVEKQNAETYVLPEGWDSRDAVANDLDCSPEKVDDHLRPGLKSGRFIKQSYKVWDKNLGRNIMVVAYHDTAQDTAKPAPAAVDMAKLQALHAEGKTYAEIGKVVGLSRNAVRFRIQRAK